MKIKTTSLLCIASLFSLSAYAGVKWNIQMINNTDYPIAVTHDDFNCFYLMDFDNTVTIAPHSAVLTKSEENNSGTCNATFYRMHQLNLTAQVLAPAPVSYKLMFLGDFTNSPNDYPTVTLGANGFYEKTKTAYTGNGASVTWISATTSVVSGRIYFGYESADRGYSIPVDLSVVR